MCASLKGLKVGWWRTDNGLDLFGDGPADTLSEAFVRIKKLLGRKPSLEEALNAMVRALQPNRPAILQDPDLPVLGLTAELSARCVSVHAG